MPAAPLIAAAERCVHLADQVDYSIRRWMIRRTTRLIVRRRGRRAHANVGLAPASAAGARFGAARQGCARRRDGALSEMQAAIARALGAEYDLAEPLPDRLADLLRQLEQRNGAGGYRTMAAGRT